MTLAVTPLEIGDIDRALLAAGLATLGCAIPEEVQVPAGSLNQDGVGRRLLARAFATKMLPMLLREASTVGWDPPHEAIALEEIYRRKMDVLLEDYGLLVAALTERGIDALLLKGGDLVLSAYPPDLSRIMADIDLLVRPVDLEAATQVFREVGFVQGRIDMAGLKLKPYSEAENRALTEGHYELAPFLRIRRVTGLERHRDLIDRQLREAYFRVLADDVYFGQAYDVHFNVSDNIDVADLWHQPRRVTLPSGQEVRAQSVTELLWFLAARAYHEIMLADTPSLRQFIDLLAILKSLGGAVDWDRLLHVAAKYDFHPSVFYTFWHANELLGAVVPESVIEACRPDREGVSRFHDWGDPMPKLLATTAVTALIAPRASTPASSPSTRATVSSLAGGLSS